MIVVDASAAIEILLNSPAAANVASRIFTAGESLHVPHLLDVEVAQVIRRYVLSREMSAARGAQALADLAELPLRRHAHDFLLPRIWELRSNVTAYDATYLALAEALRAPLVTRDKAMGQVPGVTVAVEVIL